MSKDGRFCIECNAQLPGRWKYTCLSCRESLLELGFKICTKCGNRKSLDDFGSHSKGFGGRNGHCKSCHNAQAAKFLGTPQQKLKKRKYDLKANYNVTLEDYDAIVAHQGGGCAICGKTCSTGKSLAIDHSHVDGIVRGALCSFCNRNVVGRITLAQASKVFNYLQSPPAVEAIGVRIVPPDKLKGNKKTRKKRRKVGKKKSKPKSSNSNRTSSG